MEASLVDLVALLLLRTALVHSANRIIWEVVVGSLEGERGKSEHSRMSTKENSLPILGYDKYRILSLLYKFYCDTT